MYDHNISESLATRTTPKQRAYGVKSVGSAWESRQKLVAGNVQSLLKETV